MVVKFYVKADGCYALPGVGVIAVGVVGFILMKRRK